MTKLKRSVNWKMFSLYGLGNILGAGIYVLVGEVASVAGDGLLWSFLIAGVVATFTAITYSAFATKYPVSAGAAVYTERAFNSKFFSTIIGLSLAFTGVVSASALLHGFDRYFQQLIEPTALGGKAPSELVILALIASLSLIALKGMKESALFAVLLTVIEAIGLLLIIAFAGVNGDVATSFSRSIGSFNSVEPMAIFLGGFLAFYAFIGFEDMVNIAEEVKEPKKSLRKGMLVALIGATVLYVLTAIAALSVLSSSELAASKAPLASVFQAASGSSLPIITVIGLFAVTNGVLAQIIMSSRVLYGLAREGWLPSPLARVSTKTHTPTLATFVAVIAITIGALALPLVVLAKITSFSLLLIFSIVQIAALKMISSEELSLSIYVPIIGLITNLAIIIIQVFSWFGKL
ncbi:amino acid permease [Candidatus Saccharibacteria bacterium]|jgi:APA family basic amino acid/polyamine antiporter|nr:amino acid permease [Candidatus Saccharibacteria bacterium]MBP9132107.1 amino acid permease [Candidatus Saccharibacteria bacterium]